MANDHIYELNAKELIVAGMDLLAEYKALGWHKCKNTASQYITSGLRDKGLLPPLNFHGLPDQELPVEFTNWLKRLDEQIPCMEV